MGSCAITGPESVNAATADTAAQSTTAVQRLGGDLWRPVVVAAMVDRLIHHAEIISLKGASYRLKDRRKEVDAAG
jgi:DNA replication protein DnaC